MSIGTKGTWKSKSLWPTIKEVLNTGSDIIVFDLETTGLSSAKERIIEMAAVKYSIDEKYHMSEKATYHQYINPERPLEEVITELTGITDEMLADKPTEAECINDIAAFFDGCIVSGYNIENFDCKFMNELYGRFGRFFTPTGSLDGIKMARNRLTRGVDVEGYKLTQVAAFFGIEFNAHSAIEDARTTGKLIQIFLNEYANEESEPVALPSGTIRPHITNISYWPGFKGFARIYVNTDIGSVYYDIRSATWGGKDIDINELDMEYVEAEAFKMTGATNEKEFAAYRENATA